MSTINETKNFNTTKFKSSLFRKKPTTCTFWSMFKKSALFGTRFPFLKTVPKIRSYGTVK